MRYLCLFFLVVSWPLVALFHNLDRTNGDQRGRLLYSPKICGKTALQGFGGESWHLAALLDQVGCVSTGSALIKRVEREGPFSVRLSPKGTEGFEAYWDPNSREIVLDSSCTFSTGSLIRSLVFELLDILLSVNLRGFLSLTT